MRWSRVGNSFRLNRRAKNSTSFSRPFGGISRRISSSAMLRRVDSVIWRSRSSMKGWFMRVVYRFPLDAHLADSGSEAALSAHGGGTNEIRFRTVECGGPGAFPISRSSV